jgi:hypothetical protein
MSEMLYLGLLALSGLALIGLGLMWVRSGPTSNVIVTTRKGAFAPAFIVCVGAVLVILAVFLLLASAWERLTAWNFVHRYGQQRRRSR